MDNESLTAWQRVTNLRLDVLEKQVEGHENILQRLTENNGRLTGIQESQLKSNDILQKALVKLVVSLIVFIVCVIIKEIVF